MILVSLINSKKRFNSGKSIFASHQLLGGNCWEPFLTRIVVSNFYSEVVQKVNHLLFRWIMWKEEALMMLR